MLRLYGQGCSHEERLGSEEKEMKKDMTYCHICRYKTLHVTIRVTKDWLDFQCSKCAVTGRIKNNMTPYKEEEDETTEED